MYSENYLIIANYLKNLVKYSFNVVEIFLLCFSSHFLERLKIACCFSPSIFLYLLSGRASFPYNIKQCWALFIDLS